jgi:hypothetical protein
MVNYQDRIQQEIIFYFLTMLEIISTTHGLFYYTLIKYQEYRFIQAFAFSSQPSSKKLK